MRFYLLVGCLAATILAASCKKSTDNASVPSPYLTQGAGSTWQYRQTNVTTSTSSEYTLTATNRDTSIGTRNYRVFTNSQGGPNSYFTQSGADYYTFRTLGAGLGAGAIENLYLKDNSPAGTSWSENISLNIPGVPFAIPVTITYRIEEKGISRTVNSTNYTDVIRVKTSLTSSVVPPSGLITDIEDYYARQFGAIESKVVIQVAFLGVTQSTDTRTILLSATLR
jgi:hypothetical protein